MDIFKKKKPEPTIPGAEYEPEMPPVSEVPITQVISMQTQGLTNNQIIQTLQRQGYQPTQIYDALAQAETKKSIEPMQEPTNQQSPSFIPPAMPSQFSQPQTPQTVMPKHPESEAIVEQIIEEKWHELQKELGKVNEWKELLTSRIDKLEQSMIDVKTDLDGLHKAIVARIGEYDKTLMDVGTEIKAMEKVFQKVLPELTGNIQELSRITKQAKK